jgi:hypothetical protein
MEIAWRPHGQDLVATLDCRTGKHPLKSGVNGWYEVDTCDWLCGWKFRTEALGDRAGTWLRLQLPTGQPVESRPQARRSSRAVTTWHPSWKAIGSRSCFRSPTQCGSSVAEATAVLLAAQSSSRRAFTTARYSYSRRMQIPRHACSARQAEPIRCWWRKGGRGV